MMSGDGFSFISSLGGFAQEQDANPNPSPTSINPAAKKKRNLPGNPDPDAEVIALSPKTLMATNRFICEICNKGFQRDQNLQLHRRGHNLPWKLKQRSNKEIRKKVYICPEKTCVHHDRSRALGDLTGIKKHFSRKHGEKKWKCEKCSKKYAVQSDWKAHSKTCGTREYKCDCGTLFSRKDSFITHRAFCDALAEESARFSSAAPSTSLNFRNDSINETMISPPSGTSHGYGNQRGQDAAGISQLGPIFPPHFSASASLFGNSSSMANYGGCINDQLSWHDKSAPSTSTGANLSLSPLRPGLNEGGNKGSFMGNTLTPLFSSEQNQTQKSNPGVPMSATALLQKAAQMGSTRSDQPSFFGNTSVGVMMSSSSSQAQTFNHLPAQNNTRNELHQVFDQTGKQVPEMTLGSNGLQLGGSNFNSLMPKMHSCPNTSVELSLTRDFLGVGGEGPGRAFLPQELARFASMGSSAMSMSQFTVNH